MQTHNVTCCIDNQHIRVMGEANLPFSRPSMLNTFNTLFIGVVLNLLQGLNHIKIEAQYSHQRWVKPLSVCIEGYVAWILYKHSFSHGECKQLRDGDPTQMHSPRTCYMGTHGNTSQPRLNNDLPTEYPR